jgi:hypothetical protein
MHAIFHYVQVHAYIHVPRSPKQVYPLLFFQIRRAHSDSQFRRPKLSHTRSLLLSKAAGLAESLSLGHTRITMPCLTSSVVIHTGYTCVRTCGNLLSSCICIACLFAQPRPRNLLHYRRERACDVCQCQAQLRVWNEGKGLIGHVV